MFNNIGKKIKTLAAVICWIGIISSVIAAIVLFICGLDWGDEAFFFLMAILVLVAGSLVSWIGSFFTYGFGELIDKTCDIEKKLGYQANVAPAPNMNYGYAGVTPAPANGRPFPDKIYQLQELLKQNLITEEEYSAALARYHSGEQL